MRTRLTLFLAISLLCFVPTADAYLDPGSGSFIIQMIIASVAGAAYALKMYWNRIKAYVRGGSVEQDPDQELDHD